jgi:hypothetical protein
MLEYEIRLLKGGRQTSAIFASWQPSDAVAIGLARQLAEDRAFEVWRDLDCICHEGQKAPSVGSTHGA